MATFLRLAVAALFSTPITVTGQALAAPAEPGDAGLVTAAGSTVPRSLSARFADMLNVKDFGAVGDDSADDGRAIANAAAYARRVGGRRIFFPRGIYRCSGSIEIPKHTIFAGEGRDVSVLHFTNTGDGIVSKWPVATPTITQSTDAGVRLESLGITNSNASNVGGGFVDVGGTFVDLDQVSISGFKHNVVLDQTEIATIDRSKLTATANCRAQIWLVNGPDHSANAAPGYTNRITVTRTQFNMGRGARYQILDDGGAAHVFRDNNFNGNGTATCIRAAGVAVLVFEGNEVEVHGLSVDLQDTTASGRYVGPNASPVVRSNVLNDYHVGHHINLAAVDGGVVSDNYFGQAADGGSNVLVGSKAIGVEIGRNTKFVTTRHRQSAPFVGGTTVARRNNRIRQTAMTFVPDPLSRIGTQSVTPGSMEGIRQGARLNVRNADGSNDETVVVGSATDKSFTATFTLPKSEGWVIRGIARTEEEP